MIDGVCHHYKLANDSIGFGVIGLSGILFFRHVEVLTIILNFPNEHYHFFKVENQAGRKTPVFVLRPQRGPKSDTPQERRAGA
jgi:hypothetical protein